MQSLQCVLLLFIGDDQFAALPVGNILFQAVPVKQSVTAQTQAGFQGIWWVIEAGVDNFAVAGGEMLAKAAFLLEQHHGS